VGVEGLSKSMGLKPSVEILAKERSMSPGPGQYSPNLSDKKAAPNYVIGTSQRHDFTKRSRANVEPGPGKYSPTDRYVKTNSERWVFGTEK
jgi:hypothetical protein